MKHLWKAWAGALALMTASAPCGFAETAQHPGGASNAVLQATLSNGLRVVIVPDRLAPVVTTNLSYLAGSNDAPEGFPGTAHALEHMMFRGSAGLDRDQLAELGALLGGFYNASTAETVTRYTYTVPRDNLGVVLRSEALRMRGLTLSEADWAQERGAIEQEVSRDLSSPFYNYLSQAQAILFQGTPYEHDALGTRPSFDRTDAALLRRFYEQWYAPNNAILVIAGDVQPAQALSEVQAAFGDIPRRAIPEHQNISVQPVQPKTLALSTNYSVGLVALAYRMPGLRSPDSAVSDILSDVLGSPRGALQGLVPADQALMAYFDCMSKADVGIGLAVAAFPSGGDPAPLLAMLRRIIAGTARDGVSPELVEAAKRRELARLAFEGNSISSLARSWTTALAMRGASSPADLAQAYAAVTVEDVNRLARRLLRPDQAVTAILTPKGTSTTPAGSGFGKAESFKASPDRSVTLPSWAASSLPAARMPDLGEPPVITVLPNGLRLIVQPEHVNHTVSVYGQVRQVPDMQEPPGQEGVAALMGQLFGHGTETQDRLAFQASLDDIAAWESAGPDFLLEVLTPHFEQGMELLAENELHPAFPQAAFAVARRQMAQGLAGLEQAPDYRFQRAIDQAVIPEADPTLRQPTPETVEALRLEDVRAYYKAALRPDLTTIVVLGDVTPEEARRVVLNTFGTWHASGPAPQIDLPPIGPNAPSRVRVPDASSLQDRVLLSETLPVSKPGRNAFRLGNTILGGGFSSRLYRDLRVKSGYAYSVNSAVNWTRTRGQYTVTFGADAGNVEKARQLVLRNLRAMQTTPVSDSELSRAKAQLLISLMMRRSSVEAMAASYLRLVDLGLPLDSPRTAAERYLATTADQIQQAFNTPLRLDDLVEVVKGPPLTP